MADGTIKIDTSLDESGIKKGLAGLKNITAKGMKAITTTIGVVSTALTAMGGYAIKAGSDFEAGMSKVEAISGASADEMERLTEKAKEMGAKTKFSATESAAAMEYMAMAGWKTEDMLNGIDGIMNLAAASGENLATTSDIVTDALTAFNLTAADSAHFSDVLAKASASSNTNVGLMGATFKYVAPVAGALGYSIEDVGVAIGLMANAGIKGEQAGTQLRATMARMAKPTDEVERAMNDLNLSLTNSDGSMKSFYEIMLDMRQGFSGLTKEQKASYAAMLGGQEAMSGLLAIVNASDEDFAALTKEINNADGAAEEMAETMQDNLQGQITILKSSIEGLGIEVYESMQEPLKNAAKEGISYVNQITEAFKSGGMQGAVEEAGTVFANLATKAAEQAPKMVEAAVSMVKSFMDGLKKNKTKIIKAAGEFVKTLASGIADLLPKEIQKPVKDMISDISKSFSSGGLKKAIKSVLDLFSGLVKNIGNIAKVVLPILTKAIDVVASNMDGIIPILAGVATAMMALKVANTVSSFINTLKDTVQMLFTTISAHPIGALVTALAGVTVAVSAFVLETSNANDKLRQSNEQLADSYQKIGDGAQEWSSKVDAAKSSMEGFDDSIIMSSEKQQQLASDMDDVQDQITEIAQLASEERRDLTQQEIDRLDDLFAKMRDLAQQEMEVQQAKQDVVITQAEQLKNATDLTAEAYEDEAARVIKASEETAQGVKDYASETYTNKLALNEQLLGTSEEYDNAWLKEQNRLAYEEYQTAVDTANKKHSDVLQIEAQTYLDRNAALQGYLDDVVIGNSELTKQEQKFSDDSLAIRQKYVDQYGEEFARNQTASLEYQKEMRALERQHNDAMAEIQDEYLNNVDDQTLAEAGAWLQRIYDAQEAGATLTEEQKTLAKNLIFAMSNLPDDMKEKGQETLDALNAGLSEDGETIYFAGKSLGKKAVDGMDSGSEGSYSIGQDGGQGFINGMRSKIWAAANAGRDIANAALNAVRNTQKSGSPSKITTGYGNDFDDGYAIGIEKNAYKAESAAEGMVSDTLNVVDSMPDIDLFSKFKNISSQDIHAMYEKAKAVVAREAERISSAISASVNYSLATAAPVVNTTVMPAPVNAEIYTTVELDGKAVGHGITPYVDQELGEINKRRGRGG